MTESTKLSHFSIVLKIALDYQVTSKSFSISMKSYNLSYECLPYLSRCCDTHY